MAQDDSARERLLTATIDHVAVHGMADISLRSLAAAIGTSHRMLIYHFGSKEGLLVEVVRAVEARQREAFEALSADPAESLAEVMRRMWHDLSDPVRWPHERLFFEMYGQALQGRPGTAALLEGIVDSWLDEASDVAARHGLDPAATRAHARLGIATMRGLLLDLLATGDRAGVDRAMEQFISFYE
ncbi:TetR/AcrR family transcriptional regulator [Rugosimonospora africana]|uniref:TetR family transcriptional regulator n=1 Tax=Rugosimonospora africana TaxID=556532 RepID=A0A8J3VNK5_9ACTN|nr:TetR/AcrR family transcriptional regulator [Rugosimonospora africana]GIH12446.1 TetR family transcriptional regulator [Rugosimonospora africana]